MLTKMLKKHSNEKGFTLMEMLIVVAIIAILIAIAIPTFNNSLNKAKLATDEANIRSGYAAVAAKGAH
jgi:prepilin-type N-terminal cleavage/methylation domain-containing protein